MNRFRNTFLLVSVRIQDTRFHGSRIEIIPLSDSDFGPLSTPVASHDASDRNPHNYGQVRKSSNNLSKAASSTRTSPLNRITDDCSVIFAPSVVFLHYLHDLQITEKNPSTTTYLLKHIFNIH